MVEGGLEVTKLLLADAFRVPGQDLGLDIVNRAGYRGQEVLPSDTDMLKPHQRKTSFSTLPASLAEWTKEQLASCLQTSVIKSQYAKHCIDQGVSLSAQCTR